MLSLAFILLSAAVLAGSVLALLYLRGTAYPRPASGLLHGALGLAGLAALFLALRGPPRGLDAGVGSFGAVAAVLAAAALVLGLSVLALLRYRPQVAALAVVLHAALAITAYVLLLAYVALG